MKNSPENTHGKGEDGRKRSGRMREGERNKEMLDNCLSRVDVRVDNEGLYVK